MPQLHAQIHARAGLVATEFSLLGLGAATVIVVWLLALLPDHGGLQLLRPGLAVGTGLLGCGTAITVVGRILDLGGTRQNRAMRLLWWPLASLSVVAAAGGWWGLRQAGRLLLSPEGHGWPTPLMVLVVGLVAINILILAVLGLRALAAVHGGAPNPVVQLWQAMTHTFAAALAMSALVGLAAEVMTKEIHAFLGTAICLVGAQAILSATWLLRSSRRHLANLRLAQIRVHLLERGHALASVALLAGLLVPTLFILANLLISKEIGLLPACVILAVANHAMRYACVLLPLRMTI